MMNELALEIKNLSKTFEGFELKNISFDLPTGYIMGLVGRNGAGKTTTIKLILELLKKNEGVVKVLGKQLSEDNVDTKQDIAVVFDEMFFVDEWTLTDLEAAISPFYVRWDSLQFHDYLKRFALPMKKKLKDFSKGMKVKLMLAVALSHQAKLLILDEPTSGLDPVTRDELLDILLRYMEDESNSILFSTHITSDLDKIADYLTIMKDGAIFFSGTKDALFETYCLAKGPLLALHTEIMPYLIGIQKTSFGFTALIKISDIGHMNKDILCEDATIDDILIHINKEED